MKRDNKNQRKEEWKQYKQEYTKEKKAIKLRMYTSESLCNVPIAGLHT